MGREKTKLPGVYARTSNTRRHGGKPDVCFDITYKIGERKIWEKVGWKSEGYSAAYAAQVRSERIRTLRHGDMPIPAHKRKELTIADAWKRYNDDHLTPRSKNPLPDISRYTNHIKPKLGNRAMSQLTPHELTQFAARLAETLSPQTVRHVLILLARIYNRCIAWKLYTGDNPVRGVDLPDIDNDRTRWLTPREANLLLDCVCTRSTKVWRICLLSLHTGMRLGEIKALKGEDVLLEHSRVLVKDPKSGASRVALLTPTGAQAFAGLNLAPGMYAFPARAKANQYADISDSFWRAVADTGFNNGIEDSRDKVVFHTLRHTYASWLAKSGVPLYVIGELLGHTDLQMTKRYAHLCPDMKAAAVAHVENLFNNRF